MGIESFPQFSYESPSLLERMSAVEGYGTWVDYDPVWTGTTNPNIGNGTIVGNYVQIGTTVHFNIYVSCGSTTTYGSGIWLFSLPVDMDATEPTPTMPVFYKDSGTAFGSGIADYSSPSKIQVIDTESGVNSWQSTVPHTWTTGDEFRISGTYKATVPANTGSGAATTVFATEAARDAAITSPYEGQRAYITGSTVAAATGGTTAVPSGIQTIYNGSAWVCVTPVGAWTPASGTTTSTWTTTLSGSPGTNVSVTAVTGTTAFLTFGALVSNTTSATNEVGPSVSGATTLSVDSGAFSGIKTQISGVGFDQHAMALVVSGLTAGTNTFTLNYQTNGGTATFYRRYITVQGVA